MKIPQTDAGDVHHMDGWGKNGALHSYSMKTHIAAAADLVFSRFTFF